MTAARPRSGTLRTGWPRWRRGGHRLLRHRRLDQHRTVGALDLGTRRRQRIADRGLAQQDFQHRQHQRDGGIGRAAIDELGFRFVGQHCEPRHQRLPRNRRRGDQDAGVSGDAAGAEQPVHRQAAGDGHAVIGQGDQACAVPRCRQSAPSGQGAVRRIIRHQQPDPGFVGRHAAAAGGPALGLQQQVKPVGAGKIAVIHEIRRHLPDQGLLRARRPGIGHEIHPVAIERHHHRIDPSRPSVAHGADRKRQPGGGGAFGIAPGEAAAMEGRGPS